MLDQYLTYTPHTPRPRHPNGIPSPTVTYDTQHPQTPTHPLEEKKKKRKRQTNYNLPPLTPTTVAATTAAHPQTSTSRNLRPLTCVKSPIKSVPSSQRMASHSASLMRASRRPSLSGYACRTLKRRAVSQRVGSGDGNEEEDEEDGEEGGFLEVTRRLRRQKRAVVR